ncbi:mRNA splicing protein SAD1 Ecym_7334 [Eremothecium cymbalariae DBVPG|uniref:USP domain-containing protein n=1 Tax=Eremothecium cymbalariae (strain CBS 270.75 / DBVPG 7215 / KCTC 17166 / NRRL Y-17582) TaxID=931890 RepID=G8JWF1_ERECY|nr:hypothetical protein Ecym_7334 [Eremothecium cymbalariae DBVPG\
MIDIKREISDDDEDDNYQALRNDNSLKRVKLFTENERYLDTIDKKKLDFDLEKICAVTLSNINVYSCLVCGKYLQGRDEGSPAFAHSMEENHRVFINIQSLKTYVLPDDYQVINSQSLECIKYCFRPTFEDSAVSEFPVPCFDLYNNKYLNGFVGLNNISSNDYSNVIILLLSHIKPVRDYLLLNDNLLKKDDVFLQKFTLLIRKIWSPKLPKKHVSPHEFLQHVSSISDKAFSLDRRGDPRSFLLFIVNKIMKSSNRGLRKLFTKQLQGEVSIYTTKIEPVMEEGNNIKFVRNEENVSSNTVKFWILSLDLPPKPLFKDGKSVASLTQIKLEQLLKKYNGKVEQHTKDSIKFSKIVSYPPYLLLHVKRFDSSNHSIKDRNQAVVEFQSNMDIGKFRYRLVANLIYEPDLKYSSDVQSSILDEQCHWKIHIRNEKNDEWFEFDGVSVRPKKKELLFLSESYMQVWERVSALE